MEEELSKRERKKLNKEKTQASSSSSPIQNKLFVVGAIITLAVGAFWFMYRSGSSKEPVDAPEITSPTEVSSRDHTKGPEDAIVTLIEYGDFQCPGCATYMPIVNQLSEEFKDDLRVVYRHFPLRSIHRHAQISAQASEAAADQGKFWEFSTLLYEKQNGWKDVRDPRSLYKGYAESLSLNVEQFDVYMNSDEAKARVDADYESGFAAGINQTPTFFINGEKIDSPRGLELFKELIQQVIEENKSDDNNIDATDESSPAGEITPQL